MTERCIAHLPELIAALPPHIRACCDRALFVERSTGYANPPPSMYAWLEQQFHTVDAVRTQTIVRVTNRLTLDTAMYNPLRALRPLEADASTGIDPDAALEQVIASYAGSSDMFRDPLRSTPADKFGRIRGRHCVTASNVAKYDGWHGLVIFDEFHPLRFNRDQLHDYFANALRWIAHAHRADPTSRYPLITWNCLWKAGASIIHGHLQMILSKHMAVGQIERWRQAGIAYRQQYDSNLLTDLGAIHTTLDLGIPVADGVTGYATLTPIKDREVVILQSSRLEPDMWNDPEAQDIRLALQPLWDSVYAILRALIDGQQMRSFNLAVYLPPCASTDEDWSDMPVCARIVDRGKPMSRAVNFGAMEMFAGSIISIDPFSVAADIRDYLA